MSHGDTVAHGDGREHNRRSAGHGDPHFHCLGYLVEIHVSRDYFVIGADHADKGALQLLFGQTESVIKTAVGSVFGSVYNIFLCHNNSPNQLLISLSSSLQL